MVDFLINVGLPVGIFLFMVYIAPYITKLIKTKLTAEQYKTLEMVIRIAVQAAEQMYTDTLQGKNKKQYVYEQVKKKGIQISYDEFDALCESAVHELNKYKK